MTKQKRDKLFSKIAHVVFGSYALAIAWELGAIPCLALLGFAAYALAAEGK